MPAKKQTAVKTGETETVGKKTESEENVTEELVFEGHPESPIEEKVREVIDALRGFSAKYNPARTISVVDLGSTGAHQGVKYRQLYVEANNGAMTVSIKETFKSAYGGQKQVKTLHAFAVPISEVKAFSLLQQRFFGFTINRHVDAARVLVDTLRNTTNNF